MKRLCTLFLAVLIVFATAGCGNDKADGSTVSSKEVIPETSIKGVNVTKVNPNEKWVINMSEDDVYMVPYINVNSKAVEKLNEELNSKYNPMFEKGNDSGYVSARYTAAKYGGVLSVLVTMREYGGGLEYEAYNISLTDGSVIEDSDLVAFYGITEKKYKESVKEALEYEYMIYYGSFKNNEYARFDKYLKNTLADENTKIVKPYISTSGSLSIIGTICQFDDTTAACAVEAVPLKESGNESIKKTSK